MAGNKSDVSLHPRERGGKLNFSQIAYSTDCVREIANILDMPMAHAIERIQEIDGAFAFIYREARKSIKRPTKVIAREVLNL